MPQGAGPKKSAVARLIHVTKAHTKFGWISSNGLGGDSATDRQTDGRTDGRTEAIAISPDAFLKKRGDNNVCGIKLEMKVIRLHKIHVE